MIHKIITTLIATLLITSIVGPVAGLAAAQGGAPGGMVGTPAENVGPPDRAKGGVPNHVERPSSIPTDAGSWSVHASKHAAALETTVGTLDGQLALVFTDRQNHAGRQVAVDARTLADAVGERPEIAYVTHSSGYEYRVPVEYEGGHAILELREFSSNTVTFSGSVNIAGSPASNGSTWKYDINSLDDVGGFDVNITGNESRANDSASSGSVGNGGSVSYAVNGTANPSKASVTLTGHLPTAAGDSNWNKAVHSSNAQGVATDGTYVFSSDADGYVVATSLADGTVQWNVSVSSGTHDVYYQSGNVHVANGDGSVVALNPSDGTQAWSATPHTGAVTSITGNGTALFTGSSDNTVKALDDVDGSQIWSSSVGNTVRGVAYGGGTVAAGTSGFNVISFSETTGAENWNSSAPSSDAYDVAVDPGGGVYSIAGEANGVRAHAAADGTVQWSVGPGTSAAYTIEYTDGYLVHGANNAEGRLRVLAAADGRIVYYPSTVNNAPKDVLVTGTDGTILTSLNGGTVQSLNHERESTDPSASIDGTTVVSHSGILPDGQTVSSSVSVSLGANTLDVSTAKSSAVGASIEFEEITESVDPEVCVNPSSGGGCTAYTGTLADGSTASLTTNTSWIQEGQNTVIVTVSEAYDGPVGQVDLDYSHTATDKQSVSFTAEAFSERYNFTKTYASDRSGATVTIPFDGAVVEIRQLETRTNGGTWSTVADADYTLSSGELTVDLGSVKANDTVDVRAVGSKVRAVNGSITVTEATVLGDELSSEIRIDSYSSGFAIEVSSTSYGDELHYTHSESWSNPQAYAAIGTGGSQEVRMPNAGAGETARLSSIDMGVSATGGEAQIRVLSAGLEPEFRVLESSGASELSLEWRRTQSGNEYQLYSLTTDEERDRATAASPVTLLHNGTAEKLIIYDLGSGGGGGGGGGVVSSSSAAFGFGPLMLIGAAVAGLIAMYAVARRFGDDSLSAGTMFLAGSIIIGVLAMQALAPKILGRYLGMALQEAFPLILLALAAVVIIWLRQRGDDTSIIIQGGKK